MEENIRSGDERQFFLAFAKWSSLQRHMGINFDYMLGIGHNENYWALNPQEKVAHHLPRHFGYNMYDMIHDFMGSKPIFKPPHVQNTMDDDGNKNYKSTGGQILEDAINLNDDNSMIQETKECNYNHNAGCEANESRLNINPNEQ